jgi:hypothetical protein
VAAACVSIGEKKAMIRRSKLVLIFGAAALSVQAIAATPPDAKLWGGAWRLNVAKSKFGAAGKEQSETRTYDLAGGKLSMKSTSKDGAGKEATFSYSAALDGKPYPMRANPNADSISLTPVSSHEIKATSQMHGKTTAQTVATVSADGKHLTLRKNYVAMKGAPTEVLEFDR